jgi:hypothetical protein
MRNLAGTHFGAATTGFDSRASSTPSDFGTAASAGEAAGFGEAACFSGAGAACFGVAAAADFGFSLFSLFFEPLNSSDQKPAWLAGIGRSANTTTDATIVQP